MSRGNYEAPGYGKKILFIHHSPSESFEIVPVIPLLVFCYSEQPFPLPSPNRNLGRVA